jgi:predicted RND superfamily exporter protein
LTDLPEAVATRFVGRTGRYLMQVYSKANIWDMEPMKQFVYDVRSVDPDATGNPMQVYEASRHMKRSFEQAAWYALLAIIPIVLLDFRRLNYTLLAALPMGLGLLQTLGLMGLLDIPLNPANIIVLPLTLGIGMESGINLIHEMRCRRGAYRGAGNAVIVAVVVNTLTTMVGFGALMIANHQGLQSLGRVLTISMGCCMFNALLLPNLLVVGGFASDPSPADDASTADDAAADEDYESEFSYEEESSVSLAA